MSHSVYQSIAIPIVLDTRDIAPPSHSPGMVSHFHVQVIARQVGIPLELVQDGDWTGILRTKAETERRRGRGIQVLMVTIKMQEAPSMASSSIDHLRLTVISSRQSAPARSSIRHASALPSLAATWRAVSMRCNAMQCNDRHPRSIHACSQRGRTRLCHENAKHALQ